MIRAVFLAAALAAAALAFAAPSAAAPPKKSKVAAPARQGTPYAGNEEAMAFAEEVAERRELDL